MALPIEGLGGFPVRYVGLAEGNDKFAGEPRSLITKRRSRIGF